MKEKIFDFVMPLLPKNDLSHWVGRMVHKRLPEPLARHSVAAFAKYYNINMSEAEFPLEHYRSIGELFTRRLKKGARPLAEGILHPADARITEAGQINMQMMIQAKGKNYSPGKLLGSEDDAKIYESGSYLTYYLCPTDYHRVHSPLDGKVISTRHIPGELWPVNDWSTNAIENLFGVNERVVVNLETPRGRAALVMVAATNVGNMTIAFDQQIQTRERPEGRKVREMTYSVPIAIRRGDEVGIFHMGSTVVMLYEKSLLPADHAADWRGKTVRMGESLSNYK
jgi:phosphatidylserine decarboxylase